MALRLLSLSRSWSNHHHALGTAPLLAPDASCSGEPQAFAYDHVSLDTAREAVASGAANALTVAEKQFMFLPLMHSEGAADQELSVKLFTELSAANRAWAAC